MPPLRISPTATDGRNDRSLCHLPLKFRPRTIARPPMASPAPSATRSKPTGLGTAGDVQRQCRDRRRPATTSAPEYGPFDVDPGHQTLMHSSTGGFLPTIGDHIRDAALCGSCHTLYTNALGPTAKRSARFPSRCPTRNGSTATTPTSRPARSCHMPEVKEPVPVTALYGQPREGMHRHVFVGGTS